MKISRKYLLEFFLILGISFSFPSLSLTLDWPLTGRNSITSSFGEYRTTNEGHLHAGIDLVGEEVMPAGVYPCQAGTVDDLDTTKVVIKGETGNQIYLHLSNIIRSPHNTPLRQGDEFSGAGLEPIQFTYPTDHPRWPSQTRWRYPLRTQFATIDNHLHFNLQTLYTDRTNGIQFRNPLFHFNDWTDNNNLNETNRLWIDGLGLRAMASTASLAGIRGFPPTADELLTDMWGARSPNNNGLNYNLEPTGLNNNIDNGRKQHVRILIPDPTYPPTFDPDASNTAPKLIVWGKIAAYVKGRDRINDGRLGPYSFSYQRGRLGQDSREFYRARFDRISTNGALIAELGEGHDLIYNIPTINGDTTFFPSFNRRGR